MDFEVPHAEVAQIDMRAHSIDSEIVAMQRSLGNNSKLLEPLPNEEDTKMYVNDKDGKETNQREIVILFHHFYFFKHSFFRF